jgi:hypothetical protein
MLYDFILELMMFLKLEKYSSQIAVLCGVVKKKRTVWMKDLQIALQTHQ